MMALRTQKSEIVASQKIKVPLKLTVQDMQEQEEN